MNDTPPEVDERYRVMLMQRSGEARDGLPRVRHGPRLREGIVVRTVSPRLRMPWTMELRGNRLPLPT